MAIYAALAGAKKVYAIENSSFASHITQVAAENGVADRIVVINKNFADAILPEKADILVTETFGAWALAEGAATELRQCVENNLKPQGLLLPHTVQLWMAPLRNSPPELLHPFRKREDGLDLSFFRQFAQLRSTNIQAQDYEHPIHVTTLSLLENTFSGQIHIPNDCEALLLWFDLLFPKKSSSPHIPIHPLHTGNKP